MTHRADPLVRSLNAEWAWLAPLAAPVEWSRAGATLGEVLAAVGDDPDARLGDLLRRHADGDPFAGRVVLQAMLGKLVRLASHDPRHAVGEYVAECWLRLAAYPLARRPNRIAANLAMDTRRGVRAGDERGPVVDLAQCEQRSAGVAVDVPALLRAARCLGLIDRESGACLYAVYWLGLRSHEAARQLRISPAMVRWRNARSIRRLAPHAAALAAVA